MQVLGLLLKDGVSADGIPLKPERFRDKLLSRIFAAWLNYAGRQMSAQCGGEPADA
jgi:hypothetical protein